MEIGAIRTLKFRPSAANFIFSILGPNGNPLMLWRQDTLLRYPPNRLLQTEAFLNIRKLVIVNMHKLKLRHFNKLVIEIMHNIYWLFL